MSFPDPVTFFKALGLTSLGITLFGGLCYWIYFFVNKISPNLKYIIKYTIFKKKYNEDVVEILMEFDQANFSVDRVKKIFLLHGFTMKKTKELIYIYQQIRMKGGKIDGR